MGALDDLLDLAVARGDAPGLVAIIASQDGVLYAGASGKRNTAEPDGISTESIFWLASMSKMITSVGAVQLVERGKLALDAPVADLLPDLANPQVLAGFDDAGSPRFRRPVRPITLRHLLTHTSGLGYDTMNPDLMRARGAAGVQSATSRASLLGPLMFDPGGGWEYGVGTDWVGLAIESATGNSLDVYLTDNVLSPLGMSNTGFEVSAANASRAASLHMRASPTNFASIPSPVANRNDWDFFSGGAGLSATGGDYIRFLRMLLNGGVLDGRRVLSSETTALLMQNQIGGLRAGNVQTAAPTYYNPFDLFPDMQTGWSLGGLINPEAVNGGRSRGSLGWGGVANTYFWVDPEADLCCVLMAQFLPFADHQMLALLREFETLSYATFRGANPRSKSNSPQRSAWRWPRWGPSNADRPR